MKVDTHLYYLLVMVFAVAFPVLLSFDKKVNFQQYFVPFIKSASIVALFFILGDILYTYLYVWGFNAAYHLPFTIAGLPLEEIAFFFFVPYACVFIYEVLKAHVTLKPVTSIHTFLPLVIVLFAGMSVLFSNKLYTTASFTFTALILTYIRFKHSPYLHYLLLAFLVSIIPFVLVNGFLTGMFTSEPIVWYDNLENLGLRIFTIPIEDLSYSFNLIALNIIGFEYFKNRKSA
jgi:lycopene cyclase domain-containing protein